MTRGSKFKVRGDFNGSLEATVTINRNNGLFYVRPKGKHSQYVLSLNEVAEIIMWKVLMADAAAAKEAKRRAKNG